MVILLIKTLHLCQCITYFPCVNEIDAFFHCFSYLKIVIYIKEIYMIIFYKNNTGNNLFRTTYSQKDQNKLFRIWNIFMFIFFGIN